MTVGEGKITFIAGVLGAPVLMADSNPTDNSSWI